MKVERGTARIVFLVGAYALKFPRLRSWRVFLKGLLMNMSERDFSKADITGLARVRYSLPGGFCNVMDRAYWVDDPVVYQRWLIEREALSHVDTLKAIVEDKPSSVGLIGNLTYAIDYGCINQASMR